jgi:plasmid stabilization system protein ParE
MRLVWSPQSQADLARLHRFLARKSRTAATAALRTLRGGARRFLEHPRMGQKLETFPHREVRRLLLGDYELRYEVRADTIVVLRIWHTRENR